MTRFLLGDDLGNIKTLRYTADRKECYLKVIHQAQNPISVEKLVVDNIDADKETTVFSAAFAGGSCFVSSLNNDDSHEILMEWKEPRTGTNKFVGMAINQNSVFTCTSNGMVRRTPFALKKDVLILKPEHTTVPSRLFDWKLSPDGDNFAYGGDEVDLSIWNIERAFQQSPVSSEATVNSPKPKKRKRNEDFFSAEIWRARNVPNDNLSLRQPVRITTLTYLSSSPSGSHLIMGTQFGDLRRYDTKAARRPISNWIGIAKVGGVKVLEKGFSEHELFMGDGGCNLSAIDLRTGGILYSYKGLSGAVTSVAQSPTILASIALDRYARIHSVVSPPEQPRAHQETKGQVLDKAYLTSTPTTIAWDKSLPVKESVKGNDEEDNDDVWDKMEHVG